MEEEEKTRLSLAQLLSPESGVSLRVTSILMRARERKLSEQMASMLSGSFGGRIGRFAAAYNWKR